MPLLKYACKTCGKVFEELVRSQESDPVACPACGSQDVARHYRGKCSFGALGKGAGGGCSGNCAGCSGCGGH